MALEALFANCKSNVRTLPVPNPRPSQTFLCSRIGAEGPSNPVTRMPSWSR
jgi:hypothetical protein